MFANCAYHRGKRGELLDGVGIAAKHFAQHVSDAARSRHIPENALTLVFFAGALVERDIEPFGAVQSIKRFAKKNLDPPIENPDTATGEEDLQLPHR